MIRDILIFIDKENRADQKAGTSEESGCAVSKDVSGSSTATKFHWDDNATKKLLDMYSENLDQIGPFKKFRNKKLMWEHIASNISTDFQFDVNGQQCESRFKTVGKRKSLAVTHNRQSGNDAMVVPYQEEMDNIRKIDDSVQPEVLVTVGNSKRLKMSSETPKAKEGSECHAKKIEDPLLALYRELQEKKEENKERRHQEKLKCFSEYCLKKKD